MKFAPCRTSSAPRATSGGSPLRPSAAGPASRVPGRPRADHTPEGVQDDARARAARPRSITSSRRSTPSGTEMVASGRLLIPLILCMYERLDGAVPLPQPLLRTAPDPRHGPAASREHDRRFSRLGCASSSRASRPPPTRSYAAPRPWPPCGASTTRSSRRRGRALPAEARRLAVRAADGHHQQGGHPAGGHSRLRLGEPSQAGGRGGNPDRSERPGPRPALPRARAPGGPHTPTNRALPRFAVEGRFPLHPAAPRCNRRRR